MDRQKIMIFSALILVFSITFWFVSQQFSGQAVPVKPTGFVSLSCTCYCITDNGQTEEQTIPKKNSSACAMISGKYCEVTTLSGINDPGKLDCP